MLNQQPPTTKTLIEVYNEHRYKNEPKFQLRVISSEQNAR